MKEPSFTRELHTESERPQSTGSSTAGLHTHGDQLDSSTRSDMEDKTEIRLLVVGKTGNGKSALCNTILGRNEFDTGHSMSSTTKAAQESTTVREGYPLRVMDTPDVSNLDMTQQNINDEVAKWTSFAHPDPTAILLAVRCDVRYTAEEFAVYRQICQLLGDNMVKSRLVVAFTLGDRHDGDIREELKTVCPELTNVLNDASWRYVVFDKTADEDRKAQMFRELLVQVQVQKIKIPTKVVKQLCSCLMQIILLPYMVFLFIASLPCDAWKWIRTHVCEGRGQHLYRRLVEEPTGHRQ